MDMVITGALGLIQLALAVLGIRVSLKPAADKWHWPVIGAFVVLGVSGVGLTLWQQTRSTAAQQALNADVAQAAKASAALLEETRRAKSPDVARLEAAQRLNGTLRASLDLVQVFRNQLRGPRSEWSCSKHIAPDWSSSEFAHFAGDAELRHKLLAVETSAADVSQGLEALCFTPNAKASVNKTLSKFEASVLGARARLAIYLPPEAR